MDSDQVYKLYENFSQKLDMLNINTCNRVFRLNENRLVKCEEISADLTREITSIVVSNDLESNKLKKINQDQSLMIHSVKELANKAETFRHSILSFDSRLKNSELESKDGVHCWKISNFGEKLLEAKSGRMAFIDSSPFFTSNYGYKMCTRIYLNGDGPGRGTHLSIYFILLKGEYDSLLRWPFRQQIEFMLLDQNVHASNHISEKFKPDPNSASFRRPLGQMNVASGLPLFCSHLKLTDRDQQYVKDNTIFIKTLIDLTGLSDL